MLINNLYYLLKPYLPWSLRMGLRRARAQFKRKSSANTWPIDRRAGSTPHEWPGWPQGKRFAFVLSHDVEGARGVSRIERLMNLEQKHGFRSSFNLVPEGDYTVPSEVRGMMEENGFEVGVHGLQHDGKLYKSKSEFAKKAARIREYLREWNATGFRSPLMQHKLGWLHELGAEYDASTFDTDPFEPESDGVKTIFPFWVPGNNGDGFVELPYTLVQDFTLYVVLGEKDNRIWKQKLDWVAGQGGMVLMNTHPDYMCFEGTRGKDEYPVSWYEDLLEYVREKYEGKYWHALPREVAWFYRDSIPATSRNSRKKVCIVGRANYGADQRMKQHAEALARRGDQVDVIALDAGDAPGTEEIGGILVSRIRSGNQSETFGRFRFSVSCANLLTRLHRLNRYDVVHIFSEQGSLASAAWYPRLTGTPVILDDVRAMRKATTNELAEYLTRIDSLSTEIFGTSHRLPHDEAHMYTSSPSELSAKSSRDFER
jgi:peptidoglycan/xylan/chitin deacetylase (PgdA/CDA1 family)